MAAIEILTMKTKKNAQCNNYVVRPSESIALRNDYNHYEKYFG